MEAEETSVPATPEDPLIGTFVGEYKVERKLGQGGMGTVYAAIHPLIGKKAAIKVMNALLCVDPVAVVRFIHEARAVNEIGHPNIVDVFSFGRLPDGRSYLVMEWLQGQTLYERMWRGRVPLAEALHVVEQIADALDAAHDKGIIHRDLKPANVFLVPVRGRADQVKLLDFGVAKLRSAETQPGDPTRTRTGFVVGTPDYISPEQARARNVDHRTDIYALGVVAFELILGQQPFVADSPMDVVRLHMTEPPPDPRRLWPQIPAALQALLLAMLSKDPDGRPSLSEVRARLQMLRAQALLPQPAPPRRRVQRRTVQLSIGAASLAMGMAMLLGMLFAPKAPVSSAKADEAPKKVRVQAAPEPPRAPPALPMVPAARVTPPTAIGLPEAPRAVRKALKLRRSSRVSDHDGDYLVDPFDTGIKER